MRHSRVNISIAGLILSLISPFSHAGVTNVTAIPGAVTVPVTGSAALRLNWQVSRIEQGANATTSSPAALLQIQGSTIASLGSTLTRTTALPSVGLTETLRFSETLVISAALTRLIAESPAGSVRIVRTFHDQQQNAPVTESIPVSAGQNSSSELSVRRIDLSFDSKARNDVIQRGEHLRAIVDIAFRSSGVLRAEWRLIDPSASLGQATGRILQVVQKNLVSSGEGRTRIISPPLPSQQTGLYLLAFTVQQNNQIDTPILRYFVLDKKRDQLTELSDIKTTSPVNRALLTQDTQFAWQPIENAYAYQVAIFNKGDTVPVSGKLVTSQQSQLSLSDFSRDWLLPGYEYSWQVRAFDQQGNLIARSSTSHLILPD